MKMMAEQTIDFRLKQIIIIYQHSFQIFFFLATFILMFSEEQKSSK